MTRRTTLADVAASAEVSVALASIVMRNAAGATAESRRRVMRAASELDYRPDARARMLRSNRSRLLGVVFGVSAGILYLALRAFGAPRPVAIAGTVVSAFPNMPTFW